ncbi:MAG TPA: DnaA N-terminal domain-containing protein, partial [Verrucomicrobiae bacterium]|nr:DnaA N-terminal domain-containing protein [Verrucomicrobiae bacterium]
MHKTADKLWAEALEILRQMLNPETFKLWFSRITAKSVTGTTIRLEVIDEFNGVWLKENYLGLIRDVLARVSGQLWTIEFEVGKAAAPSALPEPPPVPVPAGKPASHNGGARSQQSALDSV